MEVQAEARPSWYASSHGSACSCVLRRDELLLESFKTLKGKRERQLHTGQLPLQLTIKSLYHHARSRTLPGTVHMAARFASRPSSSREMASNQVRMKSSSALLWSLVAVSKIPTTPEDSALPCSNPCVKAHSLQVGSVYRQL